MFLQLHKPPVLIDEVQYAPELFTYIERYIKGLSDAIDSLKFLRFITAVAARCSQMVNVAEIARDADINQNQAKKMVGYFRNFGYYCLSSPIF